MKRSVIILLAAAAALAALPSQAQQAGSLQFGGAVLNRDIQMPADLAQLSQTHAFGTARAMGMGGAFVSLGADLTSMTLNPAGLGMYRRNEITLTPLVSLSSASTGGTSEWLDNSRSRFSLANLGVALNLYENPKRGLVSLTLGIGVNRVADFNTRYSFSSESRYDSGTGQLMPTIADIFGQQLGQAGIWPAANGSLGYNADPAFWPAILGYNGYMLNVENNGREDLWVPSYIGHNASVGHSMDVVHSGSINEFSLSVGGNIDNVVYFGASLGVQSVRRTSRVTYQEEYLYPGSDGVALDRDGRPLEAQLDYASLQQRQTLSGAGVNFKLGVTVRPVAGLRLGAAFHTPTYYSLSQLYRGDIETYGRNNTTHEGRGVVRQHARAARRGFVELELHLAGAAAAGRFVHLRPLRHRLGRLRARLVQRHAREEPARRGHEPRLLQGRLQAQLLRDQHPARGHRGAPRALRGAACGRRLHRLDVPRPRGADQLAGRLRDALLHRRRGGQPLAHDDPRRGLPVG